MKEQLMIATFLGALSLVSLSDQAAARTVRATDMTSNEWSQMMKNDQQELVVEFRQGDDLPVNFTSEGDLLESVSSGVSRVRVKRSFWLRMRSQDLEMSLDGNAFHPLRDLVKGGFEAGASSSEQGLPANAISLGLKMFLK